MADELLLSMGDTEGIDYTMKEYMKLVAKTQACVDRLNEQGEHISSGSFCISSVAQEAAGPHTRWSWRCGPTT